MSRQPDKKIAVDISGICSAMDDNSLAFQHYLDLETGDVVSVSEMEPELDRDISQRIGENPDRYALIPPIPSREAHGHMEDFIYTIEDEDLRDRLGHAIRGRGAFRRFKDVLNHNPEEQTRWYHFKHNILKREAMEWLESLQIAAADKYPGYGRVEEEIKRRQEETERSIGKFVERASEINGVIEVSLFGSLAGGKKLGGDIDLMVFVEDARCINELARCKREICGTHHCSLDVFVFTKEREFLGNICHRKRCPTFSADCHVPLCGEIKYVRRYARFDFDPRRAVKPGLKLLWLHPAYPESVSQAW